MSDLGQTIDNLFANYSDAVPGCAVGVMRDGKTLFAKGYGIADLEHQVPVTLRSMFYMASVSKQFTAFVVLLLAEDGKFRLTDSIRKTIPELPAYADEVTIYHLLTHTSGIRDFQSLAEWGGMHDEHVHTDASALKIICRQERLNFDPGSAFLYSNSGYFLSSLIVKRVTGKPLGDFARERVFEPLGMNASLFQHDHSSLVFNKAHGYVLRDETWHTSNSMLDVVGGGGMYSCVDDMLCWLKNFDRTKLGAGPLNLMQTRGKLCSGQKIDYGMGLVPSPVGQLKWFGHAGGLGGYRSAMLRFPDQRLSVVVCSNNGSASSVQLAFGVANAFEPDADPETMAPPKPLELPAERPLSEGEKRAFAGDYRSQEVDVTYRILTDAQAMSIALGDGPEFCLRNLGEDKMLIVDQGVRAGELKFERIAGTITGFELNVDRALGLRFERIG